MASIRRQQPNFLSFEARKREDMVIDSFSLVQFLQRTFAALALERDRDDEYELKWAAIERLKQDDSPTRDLQDVERLHFLLDSEAVRLTLQKPLWCLLLSAAETYVSLMMFILMGKMSRRKDEAEFLQEGLIQKRNRNSTSSFGSERDRDDEYELKWAAIERLSTVRRMRTSVLDQTVSGDEEQKEKKVVDVAKLGALERRLFVEKLIKHIENDNLRLLQKLRGRIDRVNVKLPTIEVRYKNLCVEAECEVVQGKPLPTLWNSVKGILLGLTKVTGLKAERTKISILKDISGIIKPSRKFSWTLYYRMTLLLGPPGCGKTTFLLALAGKLDKSLKATGEICYNGFKFEEFVPEKTSSYVSQHDLHIPEMTVRETLDFSARFQGVGCRAEIMKEVSRREKQEGIIPEPDIDLYMKAISMEGLERTYHIGQRLDEELLKPYDKSQNHKNALSFSIYSLPKSELFKACLAREFLLMKRHSFTYIFKTTQLTISAIITMTVFLRTTLGVDVLHANNYLGALFYTLLSIMFNGFPELALSVSRLPVFYKQRDFYFYPAWAYAIPAILLKIPISLLESLLWISITYYTIGYSPEGIRFLRQFVLLFVVHQMSISMFRFLASYFQTMVTSIVSANLTLLIVLAFGGFIIPQSYIPGWLKWGFWSSPLTYAEIGFAVNEFLGPRWKIPSANRTVGQQVLTSRGLNFSGNFYWISLGALIGYILLFNIAFTLAMTFKKPPGRSRAIISSEKLSQIQGGDHNNTIDMTNTCTYLSNGSPKESKRTRRTVLPFMPLIVTFQDVQYYVDTPLEMKKQGYAGKKLQLLHNITGAFQPGVLTALMGVSGAGKTTLMDVLSGRKTGGTIEGEIRIGGYPKVQETFARISGYCEQNDIHSLQVTVEESVVYSAWLRLPSQIDQTSRSEFVNEVLETIELDEIRDSLVGMPGVNGLSTEQRKRLTIAVELRSSGVIAWNINPFERYFNGGKDLFLNTSPIFVFLATVRMGLKKKTTSKPKFAEAQGASSARTSGDDQIPTPLSPVSSANGKVEPLEVDSTDLSEPLSFNHYFGHAGGAEKNTAFSFAFEYLVFQNAYKERSKLITQAFPEILRSLVTDAKFETAEREVLKKPSFLFGDSVKMDPKRVSEGNYKWLRTICAQTTGKRASGVKQGQWTEYLFRNLWDKEAEVTRLVASTLEEITERINDTTSHYTCEVEEDVFPTFTTFESFHYQAEVPISDMALFAGFLTLWLKRCVVPTRPMTLLQ
ncbi:pleiotropic drug resistance protein 3-like [Asparagus officinalis]|uniref:pleiotropic drug resistance protein 3-like n=1 Tax=Asparagus officinalis TaxID=4686 RepID=UPI00098E1FD3|nr:pleiotropic drug resistance protein 3-like [Asparagus officinalis]